MKKLMFPLFVFFVLSCSTDDGNTSVPPNTAPMGGGMEEEVPENIFEGDVLLSTNDQITTFGEERYTEITGSLIIGPPEGILTTSITDLGPLNTLSIVRGDFGLLQNPNLESIDGLQNLTILGGDIGIIDNNRLSSINELSPLNAVQGSVFITENPRLTSVPFLSNITSIPGNFQFSSTALTSFQDIENIIEISGIFELSFHPSITSIDLPNLVRVGSLNLSHLNVSTLEGLEGLTTVDGFAQISDNDALVSLNGIQNLTSIGSELASDINNTVALRIAANNVLSMLDGFDNLNSLNGEFQIQQNPALTEIRGFNGLTSVDDLFVISDNPVLATISGFNNMTVLNTELNLSRNSSLTTVSGFSQLTSIDNHLILLDLPQLTNIDGFRFVTGVNELTVQGTGLTDFRGFESLSAIRNPDVLRGLNIRDNLGLTSLNGFEALINASGSYRISGNPVLADFCGIRNALITRTTRFANLSITTNAFNPTLTDILDGNCAQL